MAQGFARKLGVIGPASATDNGIAVFDGTSGDIIKNVAYDMFADQVNGRLTLTSGTPVTTADVTGATTIYFTPYKGNNIAVWDLTNSVWKRFEFTEISIAVPATTTQMYDVWAYDNSGVLALEVLAWTNDTTRATALTTQDGVYVKTGALDRRYLGSFRTTSVSGQTEDSIANRFLWNYYNGISKYLYVNEGTTHTYTTALWRYWNNNQANADVGFITGLSSTFIANLHANWSSNASQTQSFLGIGLNTNAPVSSGTPSVANNNTGLHTVSVQRLGVSAIGYNFIAGVEYGGATTATYSVMNLNAKLLF